MSDEWNTKNQAAKKTWIELKLLAQIADNRVFKTTGKLKMSQLTFFKTAGTPAIRNFGANSISAQLDNSYRKRFRAKFESGVTRKDATAAMAEILADKDKTVAELAAVVDDMYKFRKEK